MTARDHIARRSNYGDTLDFFPTPGYVTRALMEEVIPGITLEAANLRAWEPACGGGHISEVLQEYFGEVISSDIKDYGYPGTIVDDFNSKMRKFEKGHLDAIITNPPYGAMQNFVEEALRLEPKVLALLTRVQFLEGQNRYKSVFSKTPPTTVAVFSDRIPFKQGKVVRKASKMFTHIWAVWEKDRTGSELMWIHPDAQTKYEKLEDYDED